MKKKYNVFIIVALLVVIALLLVGKNNKHHRKVRLFEKSDYSAEYRYNKSENDIKAFIYKWFAGFDHQAYRTFFVRHLTKDININFPDMQVNSKKDFRKWYKKVTKNIKQNSHSLSNLTVKGNDKTGWIADVDILWEAKDYKGNDIKAKIHQKFYIVVKKYRKIKKIYIKQIKVSTK